MVSDSWGNDPAVGERQRFAVPPAEGEVDGIDLALLDPGNEDDRRLLIEAEHPELHDALDEGEASSVPCRAPGRPSAPGAARRAPAVRAAARPAVHPLR